MTSSYMLSIVTMSPVFICSGLDAISNKMLLLQLSPTCAELPYCILALIIAFVMFDIAASP